MTVQITIIGTGQIGTSMGLALGEHKEMFYRKFREFVRILCQDKQTP